MIVICPRACIQRILATGSSFADVHAVNKSLLGPPCQCPDIEQVQHKLHGKSTTHWCCRQGPANQPHVHALWWGQSVAAQDIDLFLALAKKFTITTCSSNVQCSVMCSMIIERAESTLKRHCRIQCRNMTDNAAPRPIALPSP